MIRHRGGIDVRFSQKRISGHYRLWNDRTGICEMRHMPVVGIFGADPRQIGPGALRAPLERMVVHAFGRQGIVAIAFDLIAQRPDHLRVAEVATFANVDVAPSQLERRVRPDAIDHLDGAFEIE